MGSDPTQAIRERLDADAAWRKAVLAGGTGFDATCDGPEIAATADLYAAAIRAVLDTHRHDIDCDDCLTCADGRLGVAVGTQQEWPCDTVIAIARGLHMEVSDGE